MDDKTSEMQIVNKCDSDENKKKSWRALVAYWILGLCNNYGYVVMLSAAFDILHDQEPDKQIEHLRLRNSTNDGTMVRDCNYMSTGAILLADILPSLLVKLIAPFIPFFIHVRVAICVVLAAGGYLLVGFSDARWMSLSGVVLTSLCSGLGEVTFLQYSSYFDKNVVSTWSSGTGGAGVFGSLSYAALAAALDPRKAMFIMLIIPVLMAIAFWVILPKPLEKLEGGGIQSRVNEEEISNPKEAFKKKLKLIPGLMKYMIPLGLVYFFEYFINQGMFELIYFDDIFIDHDTQYHWLQVDYQIGVFISRSSVNFLHIKNIWLMSVFQLVNVILFTTEAVFFYTPSIFIVLAFTLWEGLLGGAAYVNTFYKISQEVPEDRKQFSLSTTSFADTMGITLAGILAIIAHNGICDLPKPDRVTF